MNFPSLKGHCIHYPIVWYNKTANQARITGHPVPEQSCVLVIENAPDLMHPHIAIVCLLGYIDKVSWNGWHISSNQHNQKRNSPPTSSKWRTCYMTTIFESFHLVKTMLTIRKRTYTIFFYVILVPCNLLINKQSLITKFLPEVSDYFPNFPKLFTDISTLA